MVRRYASSTATPWTFWAASTIESVNPAMAMAIANTVNTGAKPANETASAMTTVPPSDTAWAPNRRISGAGRAEASMAASGLIATMSPKAVLDRSKDALISG